MKLEKNKDLAYPQVIRNNTSDALKRNSENIRIFLIHTSCVGNRYKTNFYGIDL